MKSPTPAHPLPASGGTYIRNADGSLTLQEVVEDMPSAPTPEPASAPKQGKPVKES